METTTFPYLVSFELWEGEPGVGRLLTPTFEGTYTLRRNARHTGRARLWLTGREDRCVYRPVSYTWDDDFLGGREFNRFSEERRGEWTYDRGIQTSRVRSQAVPHSITVQVQEFDTASRTVGHREPLLRFSVEFLEPPPVLRRHPPIRPGTAPGGERADRGLS